MRRLKESRIVHNPSQSPAWDDIPDGWMNIRVIQKALIYSGTGYYFRRLKMTGTRGATFQVVFSNAAGMLGFRAIESGRYRVRVEPAEGYVLNLGGWKSPGQDGQNRYSAVAHGPEGLAKLVATAAAALQSAANGD